MLLHIPDSFPNILANQTHTTLLTYHQVMKRTHDNTYNSEAIYLEYINFLLHTISFKILL